jgi:hypothetical protein
MSFFLANWVSKFIAFRRGTEDEDIDIDVARFLDILRDKEGIEHWQVLQADSALRLSIRHFKGGDIIKTSAEASGSKGTLADEGQLLAEMRRLLRINHYSYRTETAYLDWAKRFFTYARGTSVDPSAKHALCCLCAGPADERRAGCRRLRTAEAAVSG